MADRPERASAVARPALTDRFRRARWRGRITRWWLPVLVIALVGCAGGGWWLLLESESFDVDAVRVEGVRLLDPHTVRELAAVQTGTPLVQVDVDAAAARVAALRPVASVEVTRDWPGTVEILVVERQAVAVLVEGGRALGLDAEGVIFRRYPRPPAGLPLVRADQLFAASAEPDERSDPEVAQRRDDALSGVADVVTALPSSIAGRLGHVEVASLDDIALVFRDGTRVRWGSAADSGLKAEVLRTLLRVPAARYDVSVPGLPTTAG